MTTFFDSRPADVLIGLTDTNENIFADAEGEVDRPTSYEQWCHGGVDCIRCDRHWISVWPLGAAALECPYCGSFDTDRTAE